MIDKLARHKRRVDEWALRAFGRVVEEVGGLGWPEEWIGAVREMIPGGKGMRAGLVIETARAFDGRIKPEEIMPVAAALELMQAALLIQDDVMDGDELRRGRPALHKRIELGLGERVVGGGKKAESVAYCLSDVIFFVVLGVLGEEGVTQRVRVVREFVREFVRVGFGQARDVVMAGGDYGVEEILEMYRMKTASYSFGLPLKLGAILAGQAEEVVGEMAGLGKVLGVMFQIKDDMLNVFGEVAETGKSVGSDVVEDKQTVIRAVVGEMAKNDGKARELWGYFGKPMGKGEYGKFRKMAETLGVAEQVERLLESRRAELEELVEGASVPDGVKKLLREVGAFVVARAR